MVDQLSPLQPVLKPGSHGNFARGTGVTLSETAPGSIVQVAGWPGQEKALVAALSKITGLSFVAGPGTGASAEGKAVFGIAPRRFLVVDDSEDLASRLTAGISEKVGTVTDLSHGRTALRVSGPKAEWILAKIFALDFSLSAFPEGAGRSTTHHDIFTQIQRTGPSQFDLYVFRSFARSFWHVLCHAAEEVGYEVR